MLKDKERDLSSWIGMVEAIEGSIHIQLKRKFKLEDEVERDEGIWLYDRDGKVETKPFFKDLALESRVKTIELAKAKTLKVINELIKKYQNSESSEGVNSNYPIEKFNEMIKNNEIIFVEDFDDSSYDSKVMIKTFVFIKKVITERYDSAIKQLNDLDYITKNHDYKK
jgi:hypothetical protein